jgi:hypothetical protein
MRKEREWKITREREREKRQNERVKGKGEIEKIDRTRGR